MYATGTNVTLNELLFQLNIFVASLNGAYWEVLESQSTSAGYTSGQAGNPLVVKHSNGYDPKSSGVEDDCNIHIWRRDANDIGMNLSTGYVGEGDVDPSVPSIWYDQTGARKGENFDNTGDDYYCKTSHGSNPFKQYHFFGYDEYVYVVWQNSSNGLWRNFAFGHIDKIDTFNGGGFCFASWCVENTTNTDDPTVDDANRGGYVQFINTYRNYVTTSNSHVAQVRVDKNDATLRYVLGTSTNALESNWTRAAGPNDTYGFDGNMYYPTSSTSSSADLEEGPFEANKMHDAPSSFSLTSPLIPIYTYINRGSDKRSLFGKLPYIFGLNIKDLVETSEIDIQGDTYMVFPASKKTSSLNDNSNLPNSYRYGFCIKKTLS